MTFDNNVLIGIIHLTDIHFSDGTNTLLQKKELLFRALKDDFWGCQFIYIVVSGDIAAKGKFHEYEVARQFFNFLFTQLKNQYPSIIIKFVFVTGNHDCNFDLDTQIRRNIIKDITYESIGKDGSVFHECLKVQQNFWNFYYCFNQFKIPDDRIYYRVIDYIADKTVCFHCFNTAWMSQIDEKVGTLFFPVKHYTDFATSNNFDLNIAVLHHPLNWFNPNTTDNNKKEFQTLLELTDLILIK